MVHPSWEIAHLTRTINNISRAVVRVTVDGHVIEAVELDMADQWDFMEMAGAQLDNQAWVNTALLAASVISIDGVPQPFGAKTRDGIRQILRKIGAPGLDALHAAFRVDEDESDQNTVAEEARAAGN